MNNSKRQMLERETKVPTMLLQFGWLEAANKNAPLKSQRGVK